MTTELLKGWPETNPMSREERERLERKAQAMREKLKGFKHLDHGQRAEAALEELERVAVSHHGLEEHTSSFWTAATLVMAVKQQDRSLYKSLVERLDAHRLRLNERKTRLVSA